MLRGFDVSHYQGAVDWVSLKSRYGITWGAAKATEGRTYKDSQFPANWRNMKAAGLVRMAYHFGRPDSSPAASAQPFLDLVNANGIGPEDIMVMDMESNPNGLPLLQVRDWLAAWADIVTKATGRKPFLYCGSGYIANNATKDLQSHYAAWWFPRYPSAYAGNTTWPTGISGYPATNNWGGAPDIWQFSQSFPGSMDANVADMTPVDLKTRGTTTPAPPTKPAAGQEDDMPYTPEELRAMMQAEIEEYMTRFWVSPTGTGTAIRAQLAAILKAVGASPEALAASIAADVVAKLPTGQVDQATVEAGVRAVLLAAATA